MKSKETLPPPSIFDPEMLVDAASDMAIAFLEDDDINALWSGSYTNQSSAVHGFLHGTLNRVEDSLERQVSLEELGRGGAVVSFRELAEAGEPFLAVAKLGEEGDPRNKYAVAALAGVRLTNPNWFRRKVFKAEQKVVARLTIFQIASDDAEKAVHLYGATDGMHLSQIPEVPTLKYDLNTQRVQTDPENTIGWHQEISLDQLEPYPSDRTKKAIGAGAVAGVITFVAIGAKIAVPKLRKQ